MKKISLIVALCTIFFGASAQNRNNDLRPFEFEIGLGGNIGTDKIWDYAPAPGLNFYLEPRLNIDGGPLDVAMQLSIGYSAKSLSGINADYSELYVALYRPSLVTFVDYNWRRWNRMSLFAGAGVGMAMVDFDYPAPPPGGAVWEDLLDRSMVLAPRIGAEFWNRLRVTLEYKLMKADYSYFGLTIGGVFGGGRKK